MLKISDQTENMRLIVIESGRAPNLWKPFKICPIYFFDLPQECVKDKTISRPFIFMMRKRKDGLCIEAVLVLHWNQ